MFGRLMVVEPEGLLSAAGLLWGAGVEARGWRRRGWRDRQIMTRKGK